MKVIVTGMNGTVAPAVSDLFLKNGHLVVRWDRSIIPPENQKVSFDFLSSEQPDYLFHFASGSPAWAELLSKLSQKLNIRFLYTSSVSIYPSSQRGPFSITDRPQPEDNYGIYKLECEQKVLSVNPDAIVARFGWQIGTEPDKNHMVDYLDKTFLKDGKITASTQWFQACSFLDDTAACLSELIIGSPGGIYHIDGNPGLNFYEIVTELKKYLKRDWVVEQGAYPDLNNLLKDDRVHIRAITERFK